MPTQLALRFDEVPVSCPAQDRYHSIAPILAGKVSPIEQAKNLNLTHGNDSHNFLHFPNLALLPYIKLF
jgi:hypothetical protein